MIYAVYLLLFGVLATGVIGLTAAWVDRKVTARVHYRVGPPFLQPYYDVLKLMGKETLIPRGTSPVLFLLPPLLGFAAVVVVATLLWVNSVFPQQGFIGDWVVTLYLLLIPPLSLILGGFVSRNPLAGQGSSREMLLLLGYELPFLVAATVPVVKAGSIRLGDILIVQAESGPFVLEISGVLALLVLILCMQAKLTAVPFDMAEAETELAGGSLVEYSGAPLALFRLTRGMLFFTLPFFVIVLLLGGLGSGMTGWMVAVLEYLVLVALVTVIRNTNPRVRIDQALRFYWGPVLVMAIAALILAVLGM
jgi:NADH-quinone oxidoreductase subunit H